MEIEIVLYSRKECRLCDVAERVLREELEKRGLTYEKVDVDSDENLRDRYGVDVPVIAIDGEPVFKHRLNAQALEEYLDRIAREESRSTL